MYCMKQEGSVRKLKKKVLRHISYKFIYFMKQDVSIFFIIQCQSNLYLIHICRYKSFMPFPRIYYFKFEHNSTSS